MTMDARSGRPPAEPDASKLRTDALAALQAMHEGFVGMVFPAGKMVPRPEGDIRLLPRDGVFALRLGRLTPVRTDGDIRLREGKRRR